MSRRAVFLDRDGVLVEPVTDPRSGLPESPYRPEDVTLTEGATAALAALREAGWTLVVASNQPAAAKGTVTRAALEAVHARVAALLGDLIDDWRYCFHHPDAGDACDCRKPAPGMLLAAAAELDLDLGASWMVGDSDSDVAAGRAAGCRTVLVTHPGSAHRRPGEAGATLTASRFPLAVRAIDEYICARRKEKRH